MVENYFEKLDETIEMMTSDDFKERFKAEYWQLKIRHNNLIAMLAKYRQGTLAFKPKCSIKLLMEQKSHMEQYLYCLEVRADIEGINL